jgi:hypothetical protein
MVHDAVKSFRLIAIITIAVAQIGATVGVNAEQSSPPTPVVSVAGTTLRVQRPDGVILEGAKLVGAVLIATYADQTVRARIASVAPDDRDPSGEVMLYDFRVIAADGSETSLCSPDPDGRQLGFPLAIESRPDGIRNSGDPSRFELVCTSGAEGKCVRFGYAPWRKVPDGRPMLDWYNACVRMVRADYCGDGRAFTRNGTLIDIYDRINVQRPETNTSLKFEAAWASDGAVCVAHTRIPELIDLDGLERTCPKLKGHLGPMVCSDDTAGALLLNRSR